MIMLLLRKSAKSLQCVVNEFFTVLGVESVTGAAFSQARQHIRHTAFIELNEKAVVNVLYRDGHYLRYKQFRVLAIDGSKIRLPETEEVNKEFGQMAYTLAHLAQRGTRFVTAVPELRIHSQGER